MKFNVADITAYLYETTCWPDRNWETKEVITDENGLKTYTVKAMVSNLKRTEIIEVRIKAQDNPIAGIDALTPIKFTGAYINMGIYKDKPFAKLWAEAVKKA